MPPRLANIGITYRQLDNAIRSGYLHPWHKGGSGRNREWPYSELRIAELWAHLVQAGVSSSHAAKVAREHSGSDQVWLSPHVAVTIHDQPPPGSEEAGP